MVKEHKPKPEGLVKPDPPPAPPPKNTEFGGPALTMDVLLEAMRKLPPKPKWNTVLCGPEHEKEVTQASEETKPSVDPGRALLFGIPIVVRHYAPFISLTTKESVERLDRLAENYGDEIAAKFIELFAATEEE